MPRPLLALFAALAFPLFSSAVVATSPRLRRDNHTLCQDFLTVSQYVATNCSSSLNNNASSSLDATSASSLDPFCLESFESFAATPSLLLACVKNEHNTTAQAVYQQFLTLYNTWQQHHLCELFHVKEEQAARRCGGAAVQRPWHVEEFPLYCAQIFQLYQENRETLDATCTRTVYSDTFWEAYADYIASPLCKQYYQHVREATTFGCEQGTNDNACGSMFQWYIQQQDHIEQECLEVQGAKPFYKGFYTWKRHHQK